MGYILLVAQYPHMLFLRDHRVHPGEHGFDNLLPLMGATFCAWGPAFKKGLRIPPFENVNVYPLAARIIRFTLPEGIDGKPGILKGVLR